MMNNLVILTIILVILLFYKEVKSNIQEFILDIIKLVLLPIKIIMNKFKKRG